MDGTVALFDAATGKLLHTLDGHFKPVRDLTFTPGGRQDPLSASLQVSLPPHSHNHSHNHNHPGGGSAATATLIWAGCDKPTLGISCCLRHTILTRHASQSRPMGLPGAGRAGWLCSACTGTRRLPRLRAAALASCQEHAVPAVLSLLKAHRMLHACPSCRLQAGHHRLR